MTQAEGHEKPVIRDRRRIDPETGKLRTPPESSEATPAQESSPAQEAQSAQRASQDQGTPPAAEASASEENSEEKVRTPDAVELAAKVERLERELAERTDDLKRVRAEYLNYKRRVDRDRDVVRDLAVGSVLSELLPVLDDIGRAREHGELTGGFKAVGEALETTVAKLGLVRYGEVGDPFDPRIHEALMHSYADDVDGPTCTTILQPGYRHGDRVLRPARVGVSEPTAGLPDNAAGQQSETSGTDPTSGSQPSSSDS